jgi:hypothetical protein
MKISKIGGGRGFKIPSEILDQLDFDDEGDYSLKISDKNTLEISKNETPEEIAAKAERREKALEWIRSRRYELPPGWKFDREEANRRR